MKLLQVLRVRGVHHHARILLPKGANDSSYCMRQNTLIRITELLIAKWASIAPVPGPNTLVMHSRIDLPEELTLVSPLEIFILAVGIVR